jgi:hypothetical protein
VTQSGSFAGAIALGRLASCGLRKDGALSPRGATELVEFVAPLLDFADGAGTPTGLAKSPPSGGTFTPVSSRVTSVVPTPLGLAPLALPLPHLGGCRQGIGPSGGIAATAGSNGPTP